MDIKDLTVGESWACRFRTRTFINEQGEPVNTRNLNPGDSVDGEPGDYEGFGAIAKRDNEKRLVEIVDLEHDGFTWVVSWDDCWDIDTVEWVE